MKRINNFLSTSYYNARTVGNIDEFDIEYDNKYDKSYDVNKAGIKLTQYRNKLAVSLITTFVILLLSPFVFNSLGLDLELVHSLDAYIEVFLFSIVYFYGGLPFYKKIIAIFKYNNLSRLIQLVNIVDAALYLYGIIGIFDPTDDVVTLTIITFIDGLLLMNLIRIKVRQVLYLASLKKN